MTRGTKRPVPQQKLELRASIHNRFDVEVLDAVTGELKQRARGYNVILNKLWDVLFGSSTTSWAPTAAYFNRIGYGRGSGTPAATDTALFSSIGSKAASNFVSDTTRFAEGLVLCSADITLQAEDAVGETLTEVGIMASYGSPPVYYLVTHAMLEDMNGNPISIEKTATDVIKITATIYVHFPADGFYNGSVQPTTRYFSRQTANYTNFVPLWSVLCGRSYSFAAAITAVGSGFCRDAAVLPGTTSSVSVDKANKKITITKRLAAAIGNAPIRAIAIGDGTYLTASNASMALTFMLSFGSWFTPSAITGEAVGTGDGETTDFSTAFPILSGATVKVDGAAASPAVRTGPPAAADAFLYMNGVKGKTANGTPLYSFLNSGVNSGVDRVTEISTTPLIFENPFYAQGLLSFRLSSGSSYTVTIEASDDMETWTQIYSAAGSGTVNIPAAQQKCRYFRFVSTSTNYAPRITSATADGTAGNIHFSTPPAAGAVITADYTPACIAKDENHVFDLTLELTIGEYQEE